MTIMHSRCNARRCFKEVRHDKLFCVEHWNLLTPGMRLSIVEYYTIGQDSGDGLSTSTWVAVVNEAITYLDNKEKITR